MRAHKLVRSIILGIASLALAGVFFAIYQFSEPEAAPVEIATSSPAPRQTAPTLSPKGDEREPELRIGSEQVPITGGDNVTHTQHDPDGRWRSSFTVAEWKPIGTKSKEFEVTKPVIRLRTPNGQIVEISGDNGTVLLKSADPNVPDLKSGLLVGNVRISVDRLTDEQRDALPEAARDQVDDQRRIDFFLDDVNFDLEFARIETKGPFRVEATEVSIAGTGLLVRYNELESRIEELVVERQGRIELRGLGDRFQVAMLDEPAVADPRGAEDAVAPSPTPQPEPPTPAAESDDGSHPGDDLPMLSRQKPKRATLRPTDVYTVVFSDDVRVAQFENETQVGQLVAAQLKILFDFGQRERDLARKTPADGSGAEETRPAEVPSPATASTDRILLTWNGTLHLASADRPADTTLDAASIGAQRVHITASGPQVILQDRQRDVECQELIYKREVEAVRLLGSPDRPAQVADNKMGRLWGSEIQLDRGTGHAFAKGPGGRLAVFQQPGEEEISTRPPEAGANVDPQVIDLDIRFTDQVNVHFGKTTVTRTDPETGATSPEARQVLQRADFSGAVDMVHGLERIQCERLEIDFALNELGKPYPTEARAYERVRVSQGDRYIRARDRLIASLRTYTEERPPFDLAIARQIAQERGRDPDTLNWPRIQADYESRRKIRSGLERLRAVGDVEVRDPEQGLEINCGSLDCAFTEGQRIASGVVSPEGAQDAYVALGTFSIASPSPIPFDVPAQTTHVEGPGRMTFPTRQDVDGRRLDEPVLVSVKWLNRMAFDGPKNEAVFSGGVQVTSNENNYDCDDLRVDFRDVPPEPGFDTDETQSRWWLFSRLAARQDDDAPEAPTYLLGGGEGSSLNKEPIFIYATGRVKAKAADTYPSTNKLKSRVQISGPTMAIDVMRKYVWVDGAGYLLIEDYGVRRAKAQPAAAQDAALTTPFGGRIGNEPSQTYLTWEGSMSYRYGTNVAEFERNVTLEHSTGAKMKLAERILDPESEGDREAGHEATLSCQVLTARFLRTANDDSAGMGRLSGNEVDAFSAAGRVRFTDAPIDAIAHEIMYTRADDVLQILGTDTDPAQLFVQNERFQSFRGPKFVWNRKTNRISAPGSSISVH